MSGTKFRAWDKEHKEMIAVPTLSFGADGSGLTTMVWTKDRKGYDRGMVVGENCEIMQFTGLRDKNGKEIYEGDIVCWNDWYDQITTDSIIWDSEFGWWRRQHEWQRALGTWLKTTKGSVEVIGNIYENRDLLKRSAPAGSTECQ